MSSSTSAWRPWIVVVGGFLGAGKTSLIFAACSILKKRGVRCAVVTNDQSEELVDTRLIEQHSITVSEVTGGCFCCRFSDLLLSLDELRSYAPDVIFAEPVGSCIDIAATVLRPLHRDFELCRVASFTVLVDPARLAELAKEKLNPDMAFLMRKQIQEADIVGLTKSDLYPEVAANSFVALDLFPGATAWRLSAMTGDGVEAWLDLILTSNNIPGSKVLDVDYERYAQAEAALVWLNLAMRFEAQTPLSPASLIGPFMNDLGESLRAAETPIAHLKLLDRSPEGWIKVAICNNITAPQIEGDLDAGPARLHDLSLNLRVAGDPTTVQQMVQEHVTRLPGTILESRMSCFRPSPPVPERRIL
jgi:Ni2+-binding GTPase involved in maturation of urease and hydrogenase